ncbi:hypothetical protein BP6252_03936 [Coleophoma cylindrospora]|uniref:Zn(2)-C6 fungal-type domain-containing protein n=1 Tax=Coleophoma cylindrospora TaxID=1849047 RepID=A0A3D8S9N9_9HELO|nr:hypothetical protein BP6252_03936 [Coleophoma cylindrospora]
MQSSSKSTTVRPRQRVTTACSQCQKRKQKCDRAQPCRNCCRRYPPVDCLYQATQRARPSDERDKAGERQGVALNDFNDFAAPVGYAVAGHLPLTGQARDAGQTFAFDSADPGGDGDPGGHLGGTLQYGTTLQTSPMMDCNQNDHPLGQNHATYLPADAPFVPRQITDDYNYGHQNLPDGTTFYNVPTNLTPQVRQQISFQPNPHNDTTYQGYEQLEDLR